MANTVRSYSAYLATPIGSTGTGLDQLIAWDGLDGGLAGANEASTIDEGIRAANELNQLLIQGLQATGSLNKPVLSVADIVALNSWVRSDATRLGRFITFHGDDEGNTATGFHQIQANGGNRQFDGRALIDTVQDGLYHFGFPLSADGTRFTNEDGDNNALLADVARWLTALKTDLTSTNTGLDRIVETIVADPGLAASITWPQIEGGAQAADGLNNLIVQGINALNQAGAADTDTTRLSTAELLWINGWIRSDANRYATFITLHGDDENGVETGYHLVQNDGANTVLFGRNAINTIFDGIYHLGFDLTVDGRFVNEDGDANALVSDVAEWISYYYGDPSTTGTGFDRLTDWMRLDPGLATWTSATDINDGLAAADGILHLYLDAISATGVNNDGWITKSDLRLINSWFRTNHYDDFVALHGDDEGDGSETGFHKIQNDGGNTQFFGRNLINTVADGMFHIGFEIEGDTFVNEDGDRNQSLSDVSSWVNYFLNSTRLTVGTDAGEVLVGNVERNQLLGNGGDDLLQAGAAADLLDGGWGRDTLQGGDGSDLLDGGFDDDLLDGGNAGDVYQVSGFHPSDYDWRTYSFQGYDTYADSGTSGTDIILVQGSGPVDAGLLSFGTSNGIEQIVNATSDASGGTASVRLLGNWEGNRLDFSGVSLIGSNFVLDGADGNDTIKGSILADVIRGGRGDDQLDGGQGGDSYWVSGSNPYNPDWSTYNFEGYDTFADSGSSDVDRIVAIGDGPVDIGLLSFSGASGIEQIVNASSDGNGDTALVRLLGNWEGNRLDFSGVSLIGGNFMLDGADGNDTIKGSVLADTIRGSRGDDQLDGGQGGDSYWVSGSNPNNPDWNSYDFEGYDAFADSGSSGVDQIVAIGDGPVDIGLANFSASSGIEQILNATSDGNGGTATVRLLGYWASNLLDFSSISLIGGNFVLDGADGNDTIKGSLLADTIYGGRGDDLLDGGDASDSYWVSGSNPNNPDWHTYTFEGYDAYADSGSSGVDQIVAIGDGPVDIGLANFSASSGIEQILNATSDGNGGTATVRLLGNWTSNLLDVSSVSLIGGNFVLDGADGNDTIKGSLLADTIRGSRGDDQIDGGDGGDTYFVSGAGPEWVSGVPYTFEGYDTYTDTGSSGFDQIVVVSSDGISAVDIGLVNFGPASGIERIDARATTGPVQILGDWRNNTFDFSTTELLGTAIRIDLGGGSDSCVGSVISDQIWGGYGADSLGGGAGEDSLYGGGDDDVLDGGEGSDSYFVSGLVAGGWQTFGGYDLYSDSGAAGTDRIVAIGNDGVDIGLAGGNFLSSNGIEQLVNATSKTVNGSVVAGVVRLLGNWSNNVLDFRNVASLGGNVRIEGGDGNDTIDGSSSGDVIQGGKNDDVLNGRGGADTYEVSGNSTTNFSGYDTYADTGSGVGEIDRILVVTSNGSDAVDIGLRSFAPSSGIEQINASGTSGRVRLLGDDNANSLNFTGISIIGTNVVIDPGSGNDLVVGTAASDRILTGNGNDSFNGAGGSDIYEVSGNASSGFSGYDTYSDGGTGVGEIDRIVAAAGTAAVDIGLTGFSSTSGIEVIDATATSGAVRLLGDGSANSFNFSSVSLLGSTLSIDLGAGNDTVVGSAGSNRILGGTGTDSLNGAGGSDVYEVSGTVASGFGGYDTYADTGNGVGEVDRIVAAAGSAAVDIGLLGFSSANGIEVIDATATTGAVRVVGNASANSFNFSGTTLLGSNLTIDLDAGNDSFVGSAGNDRVRGGSGTDNLNGASGSDIYEVSGTVSSGFGGYDTYADTGNGVGEVDRIAAVSGSAAVDIGLLSFSSANGIEVIDATATTGAVRVVGNANANSFNFSGTTLLGSNLTIDLDAGNDSFVGSAGSDRVRGGTGTDNLNSAGGDDVLVGGAGLDTITGGSGADRFDYNTLSDGALAVSSTSTLLFERITDFVIGQDLIDVATTPPSGSFRTLGAQSSLTSSSLGTLLNSGTFLANGAATFNFGTRTFLALNDSVAGFSSGSDAVLEITGYSFASGFSSLSQISFV